jgi:hypothetical protein
MHGKFGSLWTEDRAQDIAEYALMLAVTVTVIAGIVALGFRVLHHR